MFEIELNNIHYKNIMHDNKNIYDKASYNLPHDILVPSKHVNVTNYYYYSILNECMDIRRTKY